MELDGPKHYKWAVCKGPARALRVHFGYGLDLNPQESRAHARVQDSSKVIVDGPELNHKVSILYFIYIR